MIPLKQNFADCFRNSVVSVSSVPAGLQRRGFESWSLFPLWVLGIELSLPGLYGKHSLPAESSRQVLLLKYMIILCANRSTLTSFSCLFVSLLFLSYCYRQDFIRLQTIYLIRLERVDTLRLTVFSHLGKCWLICSLYYIEMFLQFLVSSWLSLLRDVGL